MFVNYYEVLEIPVTASFDVIKEAFRKKVKECHPDRGGNHEQMVLVNEAWNILSDPSSRADFDAFLRAKTKGNDEKYNEEKVAKDQQRAREKARRSPVGWDTIDSFLNTLKTDFRDAQYQHYEENKQVLFPMPPFIVGSRSGQIFNLVGALVAIIIDLFIWWNYFHLVGKQTNAQLVFAFGLWFVFMVCVLLSSGLHSLVGENLRKKKVGHPPDSVPSVDDLKIISCGWCSQKIRCPALYKVISIKCPKCSKKFDMYGDGELVLTNYKEEPVKVIEISPLHSLLTRLFLWGFLFFILFWGIYFVVANAGTIFGG